MITYFESRWQTITVIDTRVAERWEKYDPFGNVIYNLSPHAKNVSWEVRDSQNKIVASDTKLPLKIPGDKLPLGDYTVSVTYNDLWNPGGSPANFNPKVTAKLHIVDIKLLNSALLPNTETGPELLPPSLKEKA